MNMKELYLFVGVALGAILWGSVRELVEVSGVLPIIGLGLACIVLGVGMGVTIGGKDD